MTPSQRRILSRLENDTAGFPTPQARQRFLTKCKEDSSFETRRAASRTILHELSANGRVRAVKPVHPRLRPLQRFTLPPLAPHEQKIVRERWLRTGRVM